jgi:gliding motility-associated protein GldM
MAGYKETPRQKMIGMMYLVLTALLALNVSRQILDAFIIVNESMEITNEQFSKKVDELYADFEEQHQINPNKVGEYWDKAQEARNYSEKLKSYIDSVKVALIAKTERITFEQADTLQLKYANKKDNFDAPTNFFIGAPPKKGEAENLVRNIEDFRKNMISLIDNEDQEGFPLGLITNTDENGEEIVYHDKDGGKENWEHHNFYHTILAADVTILNKLIAEIYNAETNVVNYLYSSISEEDFKFNVINAKVIANSNYIFQGDEYKAEIFVAAYDSTQNPDVYILEGADTLIDISKGRKIETENGKGILTLPQSTEGTKKYAGIIQIKNPYGKKVSYYFSNEFIVAKPSATISATKMNVFYRGVDNPVAISASGKADAQLKPRIVPASAGKISRSSEGGWIVKNLSNEAYELTVKIYADDKGGEKFMGEQLFRIKPIPDPIAKVMGAKNEKISKKKLQANAFLVCQLPDYVDFKYDFRVTSFTMIIPKGGGLIFKEKSENQKFNTKMISEIQGLKKNDLIIFQDIKVKGPEGTRKIESINITIN